MASDNPCGKCGSNNQPRSKFCGECGAPLRAHPATQFTPETSEATIPLDLQASDPSQVSGGERKTVTALFADIKGSLELIRDLDPEEARAIVDPALQLMVGAIHRYDGYVVQSTGDGIFALFGAPIAHEEHPQRALYAAVRMQTELRRYSDQTRAAGRLPIQVRVGVNTGEVVLRTLRTGTNQGEYTPIGHPINIAARMQELAPIGSIAVTQQVRSLCEGYFIFKGLGPAKLKGVIEPVPIYEVTGLGPLRTHFQVSERRGFTKFVGRDREIEALKRAAEHVQAGSGQIVAARGEPGVGKSRLFYEFKAILQPGWLVLETFSISHGKASAYMPAVDLLRNYFKITNQDDERSRREKIAGKLVILDRALEDVLPYVYSLLGIVRGVEPLAPMDAEIRRRRTLDAIKSIVLRESLNQPVVLIFEDLHWIDSETQALLELLVDAVADARVLLLVNYRPEYRHYWQNRTCYTELVLDPLRRQNAKEMLDALLDSSDSVTFSGAIRLDTSSGFDVAGQIKATDIDELKQVIIERAEGNPFFMEEIVHALFEQGVLAMDPAVRLTRPLTEVKIPTSVQSVLASRIDRLPVQHKELLQTLAVLGREFPFMLVQRVTGKPAEELEDTLFQLRAVDFIYEQPGQNDIELIFKHALTQQVAYNSVLIERRKQIHEQGAQAIESLFASSLPDHYEALARHYSRSGNAAKAVNYLYLAAQQAMSRSAYSEAKTQLNAALELICMQPDGPERSRIEIRVLLSLAICTRVSTSVGLFATEPIEMLDRARKLSAKVGDDLLRCEVLEALALQYGDLLGHQEARAVCEELLNIATRRRDPGMEGRARAGLGVTSLREGKPLAALEEFDRVDALATGVLSGREATLGGWRILNRSFAPRALWYLGYPQRAATRNREWVAAARSISPVVFSWALLGSFLLNVLLRDPRATSSAADEAIKLLDEHGVVSMVAYTSFEHGWALAQSGQIEEGLAEMLRCRNRFMQTGARFTNPWFNFGLAEVHLIAGHKEEGLAAVAEGLQVGERTGAVHLEAELRRLQGELLLIGDSSRVVEARECFREAINVARHQQAKSWELRATTSLARLLAKQNQHAAAHAMVAQIYGWFTEGFDTADVKDAKTLLDELAR